MEQHTHHHSYEMHTFCLATVVYNILVILAEVVLQLVFTAHDIHEIVAFEFKVQLFHFFGIFGLASLQWWIMHRIKRQTAFNFAGISFLMLAIHMIVLHVLPRIWGWSVHHHETETREMVVLAVIVLVVSLLFWKREKWLTMFGLKNKRVISLKKKNL